MPRKSFRIWFWNAIRPAEMNSWMCDIRARKDDVLELGRALSTAGRDVGWRVEITDWRGRSIMWEYGVRIKKH